MHGGIGHSSSGGATAHQLAAVTVEVVDTIGADDSVASSCVDE